MKTVALIGALALFAFGFYIYQDMKAYQKRHDCRMMEIEAYGNYNYRMRICQYMNNMTGCPMQSEILLLNDLEYIKAQGCYE